MFSLIKKYLENLNNKPVLIKILNVKISDNNIFEVEFKRDDLDKEYIEIIPLMLMDFLDEYYSNKLDQINKILTLHGIVKGDKSMKLKDKIVENRINYEDSNERFCYFKGIKNQHSWIYKEHIPSKNYPLFEFKLFISPQCTAILEHHKMIGENPGVGTDISNLDIYEFALEKSKFIEISDEIFRFFKRNSKKLGDDMVMSYGKALIGCLTDKFELKNVDLALNKNKLNEVINDNNLEELS